MRIAMIAYFLLFFPNTCILIRNCFNMRFILNRFVCMHEQMHSKVVRNQALGFPIQCTSWNVEHSLLNVRCWEYKSGIDKIILCCTILSFDASMPSLFSLFLASLNTDIYSAEAFSKVSTAREAFSFHRDSRSGIVYFSLAPFRSTLCVA